MTRSNGRYHMLSILVHWLTFLLLIAVYALVEFRENFPKGSDARAAMLMWHNMLGLVVFGLVFVRLAALAMFRIPPITPTPPAWQHLLAKAMHLALWLFLIAMPVLGWLTLSAQGKPVPFFGMELPALLAPDKALGHQLEEIHETVGNIGYWLIGLHVVAALFHHYFMRDDTLLRMLPRRGERRVGAQR